MNIGKIIRAVRKQRGETLEHLAFAINSDPSNLSRIERGVQQPSPESLRMIANALGTSVSALHAAVEGAESPSHAAQELLGANESDFTAEAIQLRQHFRSLSLENQRTLLEIAKVLGRLQRDT